MMNAKQKYVLLLLLCGFITSYAMETDHQRFSDEETGNSSEDENTLNHENSSKESFSANSIPTIEIDFSQNENQQTETLKEINLHEPDPIRDETSNQSMDTNKKDEKIRKYDPQGWMTYFRDTKILGFGRGYLDNVIHELKTGGFNQDSMSENMLRVGYAIDEAISGNKPDQLVELITKLNAIQFPILQTKSTDAMEYLKKIKISTRDAFVTGTMAKITQHNDSMNKKKAEINDNIIPLLTAILIQIKKHNEDITIDTNNTVEKLNTYNAILNILSTEKCTCDNYSAQTLLESTKTVNLIQSSLEKCKNTSAKIEQIQHLLTNKKD